MCFLNIRYCVPPVVSPVGHNLAEVARHPAGVAIDRLYNRSLCFLIFPNIVDYSAGSRLWWGTFALRHSAVQTLAVAAQAGLGRYIVKPWERAIQSLVLKVFGYDIVEELPTKLFNPHCGYVSRLLSYDKPFLGHFVSNLDQICHVIGRDVLESLVVS